jgi:hypothetical protein
MLSFDTMKNLQYFYLSMSPNVTQLRRSEAKAHLVQVSHYVRSELVLLLYTKGDNISSLKSAPTMHASVGRLREYQ